MIWGCALIWGQDLGTVIFQASLHRHWSAEMFSFTEKTQPLSSSFPHYLCNTWQTDLELSAPADPLQDQGQCTQVEADCKCIHAPRFFSSFSLIISWLNVHSVCFTQQNRARRVEEKNTTNLLLSFEKKKMASTLIITELLSSVRVNSGRSYLVMMCISPPGWAVIVTSVWNWSASFTAALCIHLESSISVHSLSPIRCKDIWIYNTCSSLGWMHNLLGNIYYFQRWR